MIGTGDDSCKLLLKAVVEGDYKDLTGEEERKLTALCLFLGAVRGVWVPNRLARTSSSFNKTVTMSDWAFGLMLLKMHREDWTDPSKRAKDAERTRKGQMECVKAYHDYFKSLSTRDNELRRKPSDRKATSAQVDEWLLNQAETMEMATDRAPTPEKGDETEVYSAKIFGDLSAVNPYLQNLDVEDIECV